MFPGRLTEPVQAYLRNQVADRKRREAVHEYLSNLMLGPDLRVLILLEYPGVSPRGSLVNVHGERSGRAETTCEGLP